MSTAGYKAGGNRTRNYVAGLTSGYVVTLATIVVGLWLTPFTLRYLDREQFAVFTLASDVLMWLGLLEIGMTAVLNVKAAQLSGKPDQERLNTLASTTFFGQSIVAFAVLVVGIGVTLAFPDFFALREDLRHDSMVVVGLLVLGSALSIGSQTFSALLVAHQQIHVDNAFRLLLLAIRTTLTVVLLTRGVGLVSLAIANLTAVFLTGVLSYLRVHRLLPGLRIRTRHFSRRILLDTAGTGIWFSLGGLAGIMIMNLDRIVTAKMVSVEMVTTLSLTGRLYTLAWSVVQQVTNTARPALAQIIGEGKMDHALTKYHQLVAVSTGLAVLLATSLWAGNEHFVTWWVGAQNYGGVGLDALLAFNLIIHSWVLPNRAILVSGMAYIPQNAMSRFVEGAINLTGSIILASFWGIQGIVLATAGAAIFTTCWYFPVLTARFFKRNAASVIKQDFYRLSTYALVLVPGALLGHRIGGSVGGLVGALCAFIICALIGVICYWMLLIDSETKRKVIRRVIAGFGAEAV